MIDEQGKLNIENNKWILFLKEYGQGIVVAAVVLFFLVYGVITYFR